MIINVSGGRATVHFYNFTLTNRIDPPDELTVENVSIPGGVVKGFFVFHNDQYGFDLIVNSIVYAYSDELLAKVNSAIVNYVTSTGVGSMTFSNNAFSYDKENQTFTIFQGMLHWQAGEYCLVVW